LIDAGPPHVIVALDYPDARSALALSARLDPRHCRIKIGVELFTAAGPALVERLVADGFAVFLDLKYHDIPTTVARACAAAARLGVWMLDVHALGGMHMLTAARTAVDAENHRALLIGVTVLTSHAPGDLSELGINRSLDSQVQSLTGLAQRAGLNGVVCSPHEVAALRSRFGPDFLLVTPGIRATAGGDDQTRTLAAGEARRLGADYLVIGRPITGAADPVAALAAINEQLGV
jgi:orotidine-5'-phosphate decarboxylase